MFLTNLHGYLHAPVSYGLPYGYGVEEASDFFFAFFSFAEFV